MIKIRLIPVLLLKNGSLVRSQEFVSHTIIGDPFHEVERFNQWNVDELIYLIIDDDEENKGKNLNLLKNISKTCFMPLTFGGQIKTIDDIRDRFYYVADKVTVNTSAYLNPALIVESSKIFGKQAIVGSIDYKCLGNSEKVFINGGKTETNINPVDWAIELEKLGVGEILIQSIERDGTGIGYDLEIIKEISRKLNIPLIALSGVGNYEHYVEGVKAGASAVSAANIWHFKEMADYHGKLTLRKNNIQIRFGK